MLDFELLWKQQHFFRTSRGTFLASAEFICSSSEKEIENMSANQKPGQPPYMSNSFKTIQHFLRTTRGTIVVNMVAGHAVVLKKKLKMWNVYDIQKDRWWTLRSENLRWTNKNKTI